MSETYLKVINKEDDKVWKEKLKPLEIYRSEAELPEGYGLKKINERWDILLNKNKKYEEYLKKMKTRKQEEDEFGFYADTPKGELLDEDTERVSEVYKTTIENFIGTVKIPLGIAGPLLVNGLHANGSYFIPLATTEAALVASIARGISCINHCGGAQCAVTMEGINRDPVVSFRNIIETFEFMRWADTQFKTFQEITKKSTKFGRLVEAKYMNDAHDVHMNLLFTTEESVGQTTATVAAEAIVEYVKQKCPVPIFSSLIEGGMTGQSRCKSSNLKGVRGRRVYVEVIMKDDVLRHVLHISPKDMMEAMEMNRQSYFYNGTIGYSNHSSNAITALSMAIGQNPAVGAEAHVCVGRCCQTNDSDNIIISLTFPNFLIGTVGGGTILPSQRACLELMGLRGNRKGNANALAEIMAGVVLAGEMSLGAAVLSGDFAKAHKILRGDRDPINLETDDLDEAFVKSQAILVKLSEIPPKKTILKIYGLYKQATVGDINVEPPKLFASLKVRKKYDSWKDQRGKTKEQAKREYVELVVKLSNEDQAKMRLEKAELKKRREGN